MNLEIWTNCWGSLSKARHYFGAVLVARTTTSDVGLVFAQLHDHYVRVGGYEFVHRAVYELLTFAERADENRWPVLLHLCADLLCSPIVLLRSGALGKRIVVWPSVERYRAAPPVVTVEHAPSQWRIASLVPGATLPTLDALDILAPLPSSTELFETLRRGDRQLVAT